MRPLTLRLLGAAAAMLAAVTPMTAFAQTPADPEVARGIALVGEGDYDAALVVLDAAVRRLAQASGRDAELAEAYVHLGIAYLAKGHETSARARFRDALRQNGELSLGTDRFAPRVVELFEKAREEVRTGTAAARSAPSAPAAAGSKRRSRRTALVVAGGALSAGAVALAAGGGPGGAGKQGASAGETTFAEEGMPVGGGREFVVNATGSGQLTAHLTWRPEAVLLDMYAVAVANPAQVLADSTRTGPAEAQLSMPVTAQAYRISVTNSSGHGLQVPSTFTLRVRHP